MGSTGKKAILAHSQIKKHKSNSANSAHLKTPDNRRQTLLIKDHEEKNLSFLNLSNTFVLSSSRNKFLISFNGNNYLCDKTSSPW